MVTIIQDELHSYASAQRSGQNNNAINDEGDDGPDIEEAMNNKTSSTIQNVLNQILTDSRDSGERQAKDGTRGLEDQQPPSHIKIQESGRITADYEATLEP